jgi:hypothetical protein
MFLVRSWQKKPPSGVTAIGPIASLSGPPIPDDFAPGVEPQHPGVRIVFAFLVHPFDDTADKAIAAVGRTAQASMLTTSAATGSFVTFSPARRWRSRTSGR